jgi:hypothetical protein
MQFANFVQFLGNTMKISLSQINRSSLLWQATMPIIGAMLFNTVFLNLCAVTFLYVCHGIMDSNVSAQ